MNLKSKIGPKPDNQSHHAAPLRLCDRRSFQRKIGSLAARIENRVQIHLKTCPVCEGAGLHRFGCRFFQPKASGAA